MGAYKTCDLCGLEKVAFTDNTTVTVTYSKKEVGMFIQISLTPPRPDCCNDCFEAILLKLGKKLVGDDE